MMADRRAGADQQPASRPTWLDPATVRERGMGEAVALVDVREPAAFAAGHPAGARCVPHDPRRLGERAAVVADGAGLLVVVADDEETAADAAGQLAQAGWTVLGALDPAAWGGAGLPWASLPELAAGTLAEGFDATVLDVREPAEWLTGCIPGAVRIPLGELSRRLDEVPTEVPLAVVCEGGVRSATAASALEAAGWPAPMNVTDGMAGYRRTGAPLEHPVDAEELET